MTSATRPDISVVMGVYNGLPYLPAAIESVLAQSLGTFEFIIINDGSADGSAAVIDGYAIRDSRIVPVHQENRGLVETLNRGLAVARAPLIARMDADDVSLPERFAKQKAFLENHPEVTVVGSAIRLIDEAGRPMRDGFYPRGREAVVEAMLRGSALAHPAVMMHRDPVRALGGYRAAYRHAEDYDLWLRLIAAGHGIDNLLEVLLLYRQHASKVSFRYSFQQALATTVAQETARMRLAGRADPTEGLERMLEIRDFDNLDLDRASGVRLRLAMLNALLASGPLKGRPELTAAAFQLLDRLRAMAAGPDEIAALQRLALFLVYRLPLPQCASFVLRHGWWFAVRFPRSLIRTAASLSYRHLISSLRARLHILNWPKG